MLQGTSQTFYRVSDLRTNEIQFLLDVIGLIQDFIGFE